MFLRGDKVERDIDGLWFQADVRAVHKPPPRNPDSRGERRCYSYDLLYPDTKNTELRVPEDEIRLKVGRRRGASAAGSKSTEAEESSVPSHANSSRYGSPDKAVSTIAPVKGAYVLVGEQEHEGVPHTTSEVDEGKRSDPARSSSQQTTPPPSAAIALTLSPFASSAAEKEQQKKSGKVNVHQLDDNERFQSTGSAYITHGQVGNTTKSGAGGGGLRAIRMLRK